MKKNARTAPGPRVSASLLVTGRGRKVFPTPKRRKLIAELARGKSITEAEKAAGYSTKWPGQSGSQALRAMRKTMPEVLEAAGLTDEALIEKYLKPLLNARETKFFQRNGRVVSKRQVVAWGPRKDGLDLAFKLKGSYATPDEHGRGSPVQVIILDVPRPDRSAFTNQPKPGNTHPGIEKPQLCLPVLTDR